MGCGDQVGHGDQMKSTAQLRHSDQVGRGGQMERSDRVGYGGRAGPTLQHPVGMKGSELCISYRCASSGLPKVLFLYALSPVPSVKVCVPLARALLSLADVL